MARFGAASSLNRGPRFQPRLGGVQLWRNVARWPGTHFCALYSGPDERDRLLYPFLEEGLRQGDKCLCLIDDVEPALVRDRAVGQPGPDFSRRSAQLDVERSSDAYLRSGGFSVDDMVSFLSESVERRSRRFDLLEPRARCRGCCPGPRLGRPVPSTSRPSTSVVEQVPAILMCLYDLQRFGADMLVEVLYTHPKVLLDGTVIDNPHYLPPTEYPAASVAAASRYPMVRVGSAGEVGTDQGWASLTDGELRVVARRGPGDDQPQYRRGALSLPAHRGRPSQAHLPQARHPLAGRADRAGPAAPSPHPLAGSGRPAQ